MAFSPMQLISYQNDWARRILRTTASRRPSRDILCSSRSMPLRLAAGAVLRNGTVLEKAGRCARPS